ncbi:MAG: nitrilase-related carbon-nitrogen hydrolase [Chthoniobacteraceae bacterium]
MIPVVLIQLDSVWEDPRANFARVEQLLAAAPPAAGYYLVLPEMFSTGFSLDLSKTMQGAAREAEEFLRGIALRYRATVTGGIVSPGAGGRGRNESVVIGADGTLLARYVKQQPFSGAGETEVHEAGADCVTFRLGAFTVAPFVCYDLRFPELFRAAAARGADLFSVIAAWPVKRIGHWLTLLQARAIENQAFVIGVNRTGREPRFEYCGRSVVVDPHGEIIADAGTGETVRTAIIAHEAVAAWRAEFPALRDARNRAERT